MYPDALKAVPKSAATSLRNFTTGAAKTAILAAVEEDRAATISALEAILEGYSPNDPERHGVIASLSAIRARKGA